VIWCSAKITSDVTPIFRNRGPEYRLLAEEKNLARKKPQQILVGILDTCSPDPRPTVAVGSARAPFTPPRGTYANFELNSCIYCYHICTHGCHFVRRVPVPRYCVICFLVRLHVLCPQQGGWGEAGINYRGPANPKGDSGPYYVTYFLSFSVVSDIIRW